MKTTGIVLLIIGFALIIFTSGKFFTTEKVVDLGKVEITREKEHNITGSPVKDIIFNVKLLSMLHFKKFLTI